MARRLNPEPEKKESEPIGDGEALKRVYVICDRDDEADVEPLEDYLFEQGLEVFLPDFDAGQDAFGQNHRENLADCDAVLIYFGKGRKPWVDTKLRDALKATGYGRKAPIRHQAVYVAPPEDHRKERYRTHSAQVIRQAGASFSPSEDLTTFIKNIMKEDAHV